MKTKKEIICTVCGGKGVQTGNKPKLYCSEDCANLEKFLRALDKAVLNVRFKDKHKKALYRGEIFRVRNNIK